MEIIIKTKTGKSLPLEVELDDTVENLLLKIDAKEGGNLPAGNRRLVYAQKVLEPGLTLKHYGVKNGDVFFLVITPPQRIPGTALTFLAFGAMQC